MSNKIVVLSGSPRKNGSTDRLVTEFTLGAQENGKSVVTYRVADMKIAPCLGCRRCFDAEGVCVHNDDMPQILASLREADALVLASPVYYWSVTAQLKAAIDRFYASFSNPMSVKRAALMLTCGNEDIGVCDSAIAMFRRMLWYQKWEDGGIVTANMLHAPEQLEGRPELQEARELGKTL